MSNLTKTPTNSATASKRRRFAQGGQSSSSRRLSLNPDVLFDVTFHVTDEFSRRTLPDRRHSIAGIASSSSSLETSPLKRNRAVSERIHISSSDQKELLAHEVWDAGGTTPRSRPLQEVPEEEDSVSEHETSMWILVVGLFLGYLLSSFGLQKLNELRPGCGQLVTLLQYVATIAEKTSYARLYIYSPTLPMYWHLVFVLLMFVSIKMGNASLGVGLPFSLFLVIKNTNLAWSLLLGFLAGKSFTKSQVWSIATVTAGISICVLAQNQQDNDASSSNKEANEHDGFLFATFLCGTSTFLMAALGILQQVVFQQYKDGQEAGESLFFTHLLGLPLFCIGGGFDAMQDDVMHLATTTPVTSCCMLVLNIACTLVVKHCFVLLLEQGESVTATLTLAVARMTGVVVSELMEGSWSLHFWLGALLVAGGSISYATGGRIPCRRK